MYIQILPKEASRPPTDRIAMQPEPDQETGVQQAGRRKRSLQVPVLRSSLRFCRLTLGRSSSTTGSMGADNHVDLLQLVDAQQAACAALIEESHTSMRELLLKSSDGGAVNTARFSKRLGAQLEHLRVFLEEQSRKLQHTIERRGPGRSRSWQERCFGRRSLWPAKELAPEFGDGKQIWWSRQFRSNYLEYAYRQHHFEVWRSRVRITSVLTTICVAYHTAAVFIQQVPDARPEQEPQDVELCAAPPPPPPPPPPTAHGHGGLLPPARPTVPRPPPRCPLCSHCTQTVMDARVTAMHRRLLRRLVLLKPHVHTAHVRPTATRHRARIGRRGGAGEARV